MTEVANFFLYLRQPNITFFFLYLRPEEVCYNTFTTIMRYNNINSIVWEYIPNNPMPISIIIMNKIREFHT